MGDNFKDNNLLDFVTYCNRWKYFNNGCGRAEQTHADDYELFPREPRGVGSSCDRVLFLGSTCGRSYRGMGTRKSVL